MGLGHPLFGGKATGPGTKIWNKLRWYPQQPQCSIFTNLSEAWCQAKRWKHPCWACVKSPQILLNLTWLCTQASQTFSRTLLNLTWLCTEASQTFSGTFSGPSPEPSPEPCWTSPGSAPKPPRPSPEPSQEPSRELRLGFALHQGFLEPSPEPSPEPCWTWPGSAPKPPKPSPEPSPEPFWTWPGSAPKPSRPSLEPSEPSPEPRWTCPAACTSAHRSYSGLKTPLAYAVGEKTCLIFLSYPRAINLWQCKIPHLHIMFPLKPPVSAGIFQLAARLITRGYGDPFSTTGQVQSLHLPPRAKKKYSWDPAERAWSRARRPRLTWIWMDYAGPPLLGNAFSRRKFRSQTSDNMDRWKAEQGRGREKRKIRRKKIRRERVRRRCRCAKR